MAEPSASSEILNPTTLASLRRMEAHRPGVFAALLASFQDETPGLLNTLRTALSEGRAASLATAAHNLKGTALNLGARRLADLCDELEHKGRSGHLEGAEPLLVALEPQIRQLVEALQAECQRLP